MADDIKTAPSSKLPRSTRKFIRQQSKINPLLAKVEDFVSPGLSKKHQQFKKKIYKGAYKIGSKLGKSLPKSEE